jgi:hypothetical protein
MTLVIGKKDTRKIRVQIEEALDFAEVKKHSLDVEFKILKPAQTKEIDELQTSTSENFDFELATQLVFDAIVSVDGLKDEAGNALTFSDEVKTFMTEQMWIRLPIMQGFWAVQNGKSQADTYKTLKAKN